MDDKLISSQAAIDAVIKRDANCGIDSAEVLKSLPSAQPEIIRCRECTRYEKANGYHPDRCNLVEGLNIIMKDSFCSYAERRTDD